MSEAVSQETVFIVKAGARVFVCSRGHTVEIRLQGARLLLFSNDIHVAAGIFYYGHLFPQFCFDANEKYSCILLEDTD